jgi:hypothetical protein
MTDVQITIRFRRKTGVYTAAVLALFQIFRNYITNKMRRYGLAVAGRFITAIRCLAFHGLLLDG